ncbi:hypothetical protein [Roseibium album]|uniref:hypothetical protein n=1 Tax=Roseibium album TaxID=311410 RepID=UPI002491EBC6|nr:hypothetical protein [Roseibium album]
MSNRLRRIDIFHLGIAFRRTIGELPPLFPLCPSPLRLFETEKKYPGYKIETQTKEAADNSENNQEFCEIFNSAFGDCKHCKEAGYSCHEKQDNVPLYFFLSRYI